VTNIWRGLGIESLRMTYALSIPSILNSIVVVFLRFYERKGRRYWLIYEPSSTPTKDVARMGIFDDFFLLLTM
jgi:hypothetical protein